MRGARGVAVLAVLLFACVALALGVVSALRPASAPPAPDLTAASVETEKAPEIPVFSGPPLDDLTAAVDRPPFSEDRRPAAAPALPEVAPQNLDATLRGVILSGDDKVAILSNSEDNEPVRLREGDVYLGWTLKEVQADQVVMERDGKEERLSLSYKAMPQPPRAEDRRLRQRDRNVVPPDQANDGRRIDERPADAETPPTE